MTLRQTTVLCVALAARLSAQSPLEAADSAWVRQDWTRARALYAEVLARDPEQTRALYRLARLSRGDTALALHRRYTELEPDDPWGWMALGDALLAKGKLVDAESAWGAAWRLAPEEPEVRQGMARFLDQAGREWLRAGRPRRAARMFERAMAGGADPSIGRRVSGARALARPAVEPVTGYQRDSDGNRTSRLGATLELSPADGWWVGASGGRSTIGDGARTFPALDAHLVIRSRPGAVTWLELRGGVSRFDPGTLGATWTTPSGWVRFRWAARDRGPVFEVRGQRLPMGTTPDLVLHQVVRTEGRALVELPAGPIRLRAEGRRAWFDAPAETNRRWGAGGALVVPLPAGEISAQYHRVSYSRPATVGYFAARDLEVVEAATYLELGDGAPWLVALDLGLGTLRIHPFAEPADGWGLAARGWGWISHALGPRHTLRLEVDGYRSPAAAAAVASSERWTQLTASLALRLVF